ncbi:MAG TPA: hypothetical protein VGO11_23625 [Chthoniobacteraceae bacterium]|jgi:hypothetical protein|nr:hypothetical protein [Chthoniobacteraceae bacterium]
MTTPQVFGEEIALPATLERSLRLVFHTARLPLRWSDCSATANFLSAYYAGLFEAEYSAAQTVDLTHSLAYLANELIENAVKFRAPGDVVVETGRHGGELILRLTNFIAPETAGAFRALLAELTAGDPGELLLERIEANAADETSSGSGLGILTLMNDYGIRFCWTFRPAPATDGAIHLETIARLPLPAA